VGGCSDASAPPVCHGPKRGQEQRRTFISPDILSGLTNVLTDFIDDDCFEGRLGSGRIESRPYAHRNRRGGGGSAVRPLNGSSSPARHRGGFCMGRVLSLWVVLCVGWWGLLDSPRGCLC